MVLTLHIGTVGIDHSFLPHSNQGLSLEGPSGEPDVMSRSPLPLQLFPIILYASLLDLPGNTDLLAQFLSLRQLAAMALSIVQRDQLG